ncbi:Isochorismate synthase MenF [Austwickia sp. TVS 96-490-7B]|nr:Isochorismate synthase MenF [Austwickia sp. TVS 96-490-7B]
MAFGSFAFSPHSARGGLLRVPHVILSRYDGHTMLTTVVDRDQTADAQIDAAHRSWEETVPGGNAAVSDPTDPGEVAFADGALSGPAWQSVVATAVDNIRAGALDKVVLARDLIAECDAPVDPRWLLRRLAADYAKTWVFAVDALVGATPEMLCRLDRGRVTSRVLAGTIRRTGDEAHDLASAAALTRSSKDLEEHAYAVRSVADALAPHCRDVDAPATPFVLRLPNVLHLASDVTGRLSDGLTSLALAAALHPSAAVCGTPRQDAADLIDEVESMDRGRYAGPVGWIDAHGDGEWGIALRCGEIDPERSGRIRLFAGCGVVAASDPAAELAESNAKLVPMRSALGPGPLVH